MDLEYFLDLAKRYIAVGYSQHQAIWLTLIEVDFRQDEVETYLKENL